MLRLDRFRWAACQLDALENCLDYRSLQNALASLPKTLDETYARILRSMPAEHKPNAIRILQFLTYSERPLRIEEAIDAIVVDPEGDPYFDTRYRMPDPREITCYCSSLVAVVPKQELSHGMADSFGKDMELRLAHFSVKEYLTLNRIDEDIAESFQNAAAKASIASVCLAYLLHLNQDLPVRKIKETFPLAEYSARYWMTNATAVEGGDEAVQDLIITFFYSHQ